MTDAQCSTHLRALCLGARALLCAIEEWQWRLADIRRLLNDYAAPVPIERFSDDCTESKKADCHHIPATPSPPHLKDEPHNRSLQPSDRTPKLHPPAAALDSTATPNTLQAASAETAQSAETHTVPVPSATPHSTAPTPQNHGSTPQRHVATAQEHAPSWQSTTLTAHPLQIWPATVLEERTPTGPAAAAKSEAGSLTAGLAALHDPFARALPTAMQAAVEEPRAPEQLIEAVARRQRMSMAFCKHKVVTPPRRLNDNHIASQPMLPVVCPSKGTPFELTACHPAGEDPRAVLPCGDVFR